MNQKSTCKVIHPAICDELTSNSKNQDQNKGKFEFQKLLEIIILLNVNLYTKTSVKKLEESEKALRKGPKQEMSKSFNQSTLCIISSEVNLSSLSLSAAARPIAFRSISDFLSLSRRTLVSVITHFEGLIMTLIVDPFTFSRVIRSMWITHLRRYTWTTFALTSFICAANDLHFVILADRHWSEVVFWA